MFLVVNTSFTCVYVKRSRCCEWSNKINLCSKNTQKPNVCFLFTRTFWFMNVLIWLFRNHQISPGADIFMKFSFPTVNIGTRTHLEFNYIFDICPHKTGYISSFAFAYLPSKIKLNYTIQGCVKCIVLVLKHFSNLLCCLVWLIL